MTATLEEFMEDFTAEQRAQVEARAAKLIAQELTACGSSQIVSEPTHGFHASEDTQ